MIIYKATNKVNGKCYIGQTSKVLNKRIYNHFNIRKKKSCPYFHNAIHKYGEDNFLWEVIEECSSKKEMDEMEFHYIKQYNSLAPNGYNLTMGGGGSCGYKHTKEECKKISIRNKGILKTKEHKENLSKAREKLWKDPNSVYNTKDFREKMSEVQSGKGNGMYGKKHTEETKSKISEKAKLRIGEKNSMWGRRGDKSPQFNKDNLYKKWIITLPDGKEIVTKNLNKFGREYEEKTGIKLYVSNLSNVVNGNLKQYKGLKCRMEQM